MLSLLGTLAFYGAYGWIVVETIAKHISLGEMTMYLLLFKQGQSAVSASLTSIGGMYEDNLYLSTLYDFLEQPTTLPEGRIEIGEVPNSGVRFENVSFSYPGNDTPAIRNLNLEIKPGTKLALVGENGSGKTTLIKLLTRLYVPDKGRILLDGTNLNEWRWDVLRERLGVIFQDFVRYQFLVGENIGAGDVQHFEDESRWGIAADKGMAQAFIEQLPKKYRTQLGRWFHDGQELSGGQWQKIALSRVFMRQEADLLVLDEPTAAMDAEAEYTIFERIRALTAEQMAILISHRFSTVRMADNIVVLREGQIIERGNHQSLMKANGVYARLFSLQAQGYR